MTVFTRYPYPPSINQAYPSGRDGRRFPSKQLKMYKQQCEFWNYRNRELIKAIQERYMPLINSYKYFLQFDVYFVLPKGDIWTQKGHFKKNDANNRIKILFDALATTLGIDDMVFNCGIVTKVYDANTKDDRYSMIKIYPVKVLSLEEVVLDKMTAQRRIDE